MTTAEATELLADSAERPCIRLHRGSDGRLLTANCPAGLRTRLWRRMRRRAAWVASLFALLFLPACRTASQGMVIRDDAEAVSKLPPPNDAITVPKSGTANPQHSDAEPIAAPDPARE